MFNWHSRISVEGRGHSPALSDPSFLGMRTICHTSREKFLIATYMTWAVLGREVSFQTQNFSAGLRLSDLGWILARFLPGLGSTDFSVGMIANTSTGAGPILGGEMDDVRCVHDIGILVIHAVLNSSRSFPISHGVCCVQSSPFLLTRF